MGGAIFALNTLVFLKIKARELSQSINLEATTEEVEQARNLEGEVKKLNLGLSKYQSFRDESYNISMVLSRVSNITPASISLSALNVDAGSKK